MSNDFNIQVGVTPQADQKKIQLEIDRQIKNLNVNVGFKIDNANIQKSIQNMQKSTQKITQQVFDSNKLNKQGREYFTKTTGILKQVKDYYKKNGAISIDITNQQKANGQIRSFTATVTEATGIIKKFNFERAKINTGGNKPNYGFVQTNNVTALDKLAGTKLKQTDDFLAKIQTRIADINSKTFNQSKPLLSDENSKKYNDVLSKTQEKITAVTNSTKILSDDHKREIGTMISDLDRYRKELQNVEYAGTKLKPDTFTDTKATLQAQLQTNMQKWNMSGLFGGEFKQNVENAKKLLNDAIDPSGLDKYKASLKLLVEEYRQLDQVEKNTNKNDALNLKKVGLSNRMDEFITKNPALKKDSIERINQLKAALESVDKVGFDRINKHFSNFQKEMSSVGQTGETVFSKLKKNIGNFSQFLGAGTVVMTGVNAIRGMVSNVKELDIAMTSLKKVTDETDSTYNKFLDSAAESAQRLGSSVSDVINMTAEWAKAGYNLSDSSKLAEVSTIFTNVGDVDAKTSVEDIVTALHAYNLEASDAIKIVDALNEVNLICLPV